MKKINVEDIQKIYYKVWENDWHYFPGYMLKGTRTVEYVDATETVKCEDGLYDFKVLPEYRFWYHIVKVDGEPESFFVDSINVLHKCLQDTADGRWWKEMHSDFYAWGRPRDNFIVLGHEPKYFVEDGGKVIYID